MHIIEEDSITRLRFPGMIVMDVNGTNIITAVGGFDEQGRVKLSEDNMTIHLTPIYDENMRKREPDFTRYAKSILLKAMADALTEILQRNPGYARLPIGISFSGQISPEGEVYSASSIFRGERPSAPLQLKELLGQYPVLEKREILVLNNVSAAAWRFSLDKHLTPGNKISQFLVVHVGSGFGSKIFNVNKRQVLLDDKGLAGELGHVFVGHRLGPGKPMRCDCGHSDHLASYFLAKGLFALCHHYANRYLEQHPKEAAYFQNLKEDNAAEFLGTLFRDKKRRTIGQQVMAQLATMLGTSLSHVILAVGIDKIVLKGGLFRRIGETATDYFKERLRRLLHHYLKDYFTLPRGFIIERVGSEDNRAALKAHDLVDRCISLEGMVVYAAELYKSEYRVTVGYFGRYPCLTLSCHNDIRYPVIRTDHVFDPKDPLLHQLTCDRKVLVVLDKGYDQLIHGQLTRRVRKYFASAGRSICAGQPQTPIDFDSSDVIVCDLDPAYQDTSGLIHENKSLEQVRLVLDWCYRYRMPRNGMLLAIGGGVLMDIVGFAAQQFRRMIAYIRIPTTLIGQVDAGIGVKVGVNYSSPKTIPGEVGANSAKNLVGAFYPPYAVINDAHFLQDLNESQIACGMAEILKMGMVADGDIIGLLETLHRKKKIITGKFLKESDELLSLVVELTESAIEAMMKELQKNIVEHDLKRLVDFGHTFSPTLESMLNYRIPHGYAVAVDMFLSGFIASQLVVRSPQSSLLDEQLFSRYRHLLKSYHLLIAPYLDGLPVLKQRQKIIFSDAVDKGIKHRGGNLNLVVPVGTVAGVAGFVDLEECKRSTDAHYHAFIPKQKLRALFDEAVEELYQTGDRKDF